MEHLSDDVGELVELVEFWTLLDEDRALLEGRRGATALGFALLLKHYSRHGRFPRGSAELPDAVVEFVARQVGVPRGGPWLLRVVWQHGSTAKPSRVAPVLLPTSRQSSSTNVQEPTRSSVDHSARMTTNRRETTRRQRQRTRAN